MTEIQVNDHRLKLYSSIKELPITASKRMGAYLLEDMGIGSSVTDIDDHLAKLRTYVELDKKENAIEEIKNLRYNMFSMLSQINYKSLAFGCLLVSVDGKMVDDKSSEGLAKLMDGLDLSGAELDEYFVDIKKNWIQNAD
jgi:hypothetical protein